MATTPDRAPPSDLVVHTSIRGLLSAAAAPTVLVVLAILGLVREVSAVPLVLLAIGLTLLLVSALDYPRHTLFDHDGVERVCLLRRHRLPWSRLTAIERTPTLRGGRPSGQKDRPDDAGAQSVPVGRGGLVARTSRRRRYLLVDRVESRDEFDRLRHLVASTAPGVALRAAPPPASAPPSGLYRRRG